MILLDEAVDARPADLLASAVTPQLHSVLMEGVSGPIMRKIALSLSQRMRCPVHLLRSTTGVISHDSALSGLPDVMLAGIVDLSPLHGRGIIAIEGDLIGAVVDAMFGATTADPYKRNDLSVMEQRIGRQMIEQSLAGISEVLASVTPLHWSVVQHETAVSMLAIADKQEWVISTTGIFETTLGVGSIRLIIPYTVFEPIEARVSTQSGLLGQTLMDPRWTETLERLSGATPVDLRFDLVRGQVPIGLIERLSVGQILPVAILPHAIGFVEGIDLFYAEYGQSNGFVCCRPRMPCPSEISPAKSSADKLSVYLGHNEPDGGIADDPAAAKTSLIGSARLERVEVRLTVELGSASVPVRSLQQIQIGQLIHLEQTPGDPLVIYVNGKQFGFGEVVSGPNQTYGIRLTSLGKKRGTAGHPLSEAPTVAA